MAKFMDEKRRNILLGQSTPDDAAMLSVSIGMSERAQDMARYAKVFVITRGLVQKHITNRLWLSSVPELRDAVQTLENIGHRLVHHYIDKTESPSGRQMNAYLRTASITREKFAELYDEIKQAGCRILDVKTPEADPSNGQLVTDFKDKLDATVKKCFTCYKQEIEIQSSRSSALMRITRGLADDLTPAQHQLFQNGLGKTLGPVVQAFKEINKLGRKFCHEFCEPDDTMSYNEKEQMAIKNCRLTFDVYTFWLHTSGNKLNAIEEGLTKAIEERQHDENTIQLRAILGKVAETIAFCDNLPRTLRKYYDPVLEKMYSWESFKQKYPARDYGYNSGYRTKVRKRRRLAEAEMRMAMAHQCA